MCGLFQFPLWIEHEVEVLQQRSDGHLGLLHGKVLSYAVTCSQTEWEVRALRVLFVPSIQLEFVRLAPVLRVHMQWPVVERQPSSLGKYDSVDIERLVVLTHSAQSNGVNAKSFLVAPLVKPKKVDEERRTYFYSLLYVIERGQVV